LDECFALSIINEWNSKRIKSGKTQYALEAYFEEIRRNLPKPEANKVIANYLKKSEEEGKKMYFAIYNK